METTTSDITSKLKFIGKIQKGDKINVRFLYVQQNNWFTSFIRTFLNTDNRTNAYNFIENVINRTFEIINYNKLSIFPVDRELVKNLIVDLTRAINGISNMKSTYEFDVMYCCKLDTLIESIKARIIEIEGHGSDMNEID